MGGVFDGLRVLEMGSGAAGPVATKYLAEQGANVVRIESARRPDFLRILWLTPDSAHGLDGSPMFVLLNPNKRSVAIDMKTEAGVALARRLALWADVLCENFAPGPMERWGLDYASLREENPRLVMVSGCLFGQTGPHRTYPGFGAQGSALSGFNQITGWPDRGSLGPAGTITDSLSPRYVALAIVAALIERERTGRGQYIDVAQVETAVYSQSEVLVRYSASGEVVGRRGNEHERIAPHGIYPCRGDDRWIAIAASGDAAWRALRERMGDPEWARSAGLDTMAGRLARSREIDGHIADWTRDQDADALMRELQEAGVEAGVARDLQGLNDDPQLAARGHFESIEHVHLGPMRFERSGLRLGGHPGGFDRPGPNLGEHTREVLTDELGMSAAEIDELAGVGVLE